MTMVDSLTARCALCGTETVCDEILSTCSVGSPDLDTRSPAMLGAVLEAQVQRCPQCGYCASDVSVVSPNAQAVISSQEYRDQLNDPTYPRLANSFLCKAIVDQESKSFSSVTWALIKAAWVCDDTHHLEQAKVCRQRAADMLMFAEEHNQHLSEQHEMNVAILIDLLRRSEQEVRAREVIATRRGEIVDGFLKLLLYYQIDLLNKKDFSRHTIADARSRFLQIGPKVGTKGKPLSIIGSAKDQTDRAAGTESDGHEHEATAENHSDQFDFNLDEDTNAEAIWEKYQRENGNKSSLINFTDHEAIWEEYHQAILDEQRRKKEDESDFYGYRDPNDVWAAYQHEKEKEKVLAYAQKVRDSLQKDGLEATTEWVKKENKARDEAKKNKEKRDEIIKIAGVVLVTALLVAKCSDSNNQSDCYYEYGKYGAERICE